MWAKKLAEATFVSQKGVAILKFFFLFTSEHISCRADSKPWTQGPSTLRLGHASYRLFPGALSSKTSKPKLRVILFCFSGFIHMDEETGDRRICDSLPIVCLSGRH